MHVPGGNEATTVRAAAIALTSLEYVIGSVRAGKAEVILLGRDEQLPPTAAHALRVPEQLKLKLHHRPP